jgi:TrmH RNA methyltransferase
MKNTVTKKKTTKRTINSAPRKKATAKPVTATTRHREMKVCGINACLALFNNRPHQISKAYLTQRNLEAFSDLMRYLSKNRVGYNVVTTDEMVKIAGGEHHEGICLVVKTPETRTTIEELASRPGPQLVLAFEKLKDPHNLGAIARSAAHFGASCLLLGPGSSTPSAASFRIAEGGIEFLELRYTGDFARDLRTFSKKGFAIFTTSSHEGAALADLKFPERAVLVLGQEDTGLTKGSLALGKPVQIPGSGNVESLNVAVAGAVLASEFRRQHPLT